MEKKIEVKVYEISYECDDCREGTNLVPTGIAKMVNPPLYEHECPNCGFTRNFRERYPHLHYEKVGR